MTISNQPSAIYNPERGIWGGVGGGPGEAGQGTGSLISTFPRFLIPIADV